MSKDAYQQELFTAMKNEGEKFLEYYTWLKTSMSPSFFEEISHDHIMLITHSLMGFALQDFFTQINLKRIAIILCVDSPDADIRILEKYAAYGIKNYQAYVSQAPLPIPEKQSHLRVVTIYFTEAIETIEKPYSEQAKEELRALYSLRNPTMNDAEFDNLMKEMNSIFLRSIPLERLILALDMYARAKTRDNCQYECATIKIGQPPNGSSMQIVFAWRNTPKHRFLFRLAKVIYRHQLMMRKVNATYIDPYSEHSVLIMALDLHGMNGKAAWEVADIQDFLREMVTLKYFEDGDEIDSKLVNKGIVSGNMGNFLRSAVYFVHQTLVHIDPNIYTIKYVEEALCRHPELTARLCEAFKARFDPEHCNLDLFHQLRQEFLLSASKLDTGQEENDTRRRNVLIQSMSFITYTLKTNFYRHNLTAYSFRLDPIYLDAIPFERTKKFPELPFAIFFSRGCITSASTFGSKT